MKKIILFLLLIPCLCNAEIGLSPAKIGFEETGNFKAGETYLLKPPIQISNSDNVERKIAMSIECFLNELCPEKSWFTITPSSFTLAPNAVQEVNVVAFIERSVPVEKYGKYNFAIVATLVTDTIEGTGTSSSSLNYALGVKINNFHLTGKVPAHKAALMWFQNNIGNKLLATITPLFDIVQPEVFAIIALVAFLLVIGKWLYRKIRKPKLLTFSEWDKLDEKAQIKYLKRAGSLADPLILEATEKILEICPNPNERELASLPKPIRLAVQRKIS